MVILRIIAVQNLIVNRALQMIILDYSISSSHYLVIYFRKKMLELPQVFLRFFCENKSQSNDYLSAIIQNNYLKSSNSLLQYQLLIIPQ